ncbi:MAG TPA: CoA-binding protein [Thermoplasmataceae archaeon]|nr:CoA-binding protein [Thermoplasmataceae archaeon]
MLDQLFHPKSVAVAGASNDPTKIGYAILQNLIRGSFEGAIYPVNPNIKEVQGLKCFPSVLDLPESPDIAVIAVSAAKSIDILRECVIKNVPFVILIPGGFSETGEPGVKLEREVETTIINSNTRILGPNTVGVYLPFSRLNTALTPPDKLDFPIGGNIGLITQSGALGLMMLDECAGQGIGISFFINVGNRSDLNECELLEYASNDGHTAAVCIYAESFPGGREFFEQVRKTSPVKPVVILKGGRTPTASKAATLHTGAMATNDNIVNGLITQSGAIRAYSETELLDYGRVLAYSKKTSGNRVAVVTTAGGVGVITSDYLTSDREGVSMRLSPLETSTKDRIRKIIVPFGSAENPVDLTADGSVSQFTEVLQILEEDGNVDLIIGYPLPQTPKMSLEIANGIKSVADNGQKPIIVGVLGSKLSRVLLEEFEKKRIPAYPSIQRAVKAAKALSMYSSHVLGGENPNV